MYATMVKKRTTLKEEEQVGIDIKSIRGTAISCEDLPYTLASLPDNGLAVFIPFYLYHHPSQFTAILTYLEQRTTPFSSSIPAATSSPAEFLLEISSKTLSLCIVQDEEDVALEVLEDFRPAVTQNQVLKMANKGFYQCIVEVVQLQLSIECEETQENDREKGGKMDKTTMIRHLLRNEGDHWGLNDVTLLLLKNEVPEERIYNVVMMCTSSLSTARCPGGTSNTNSREKEESDSSEEIHCVERENPLLPLLKYGKEKLAKRVVVCGGEENLIETLAAAIEHGCISFAIFYERRKMYGQELSGDIDSLFGKVVAGMKWRFHLWGFYIYFIRKYISYLPLYYAKQLLDYVDQSLGEDSAEDTFVLNSVNPIKTCVCLSELFGMIGRKFSTMQLRCGSICQSLNDLATALSGEIGNEAELNEIYRDTDLEGRDVIEISCKIGLVDLFSNKYAESIAMDIWNGSPAEFAYFFQPASSLYELVFGFSMKANTDFEADHRCRAYYRDIRTMEKHRCQYYYWLNGIHFRYMLEVLVAVAMALMFYIIVDGMLNPVRERNSIKSGCGEETDCMSNYSAKMVQLAERFVSYTNVILWFIFVSAFLIIDHFVKAGYTWMLKGRLYVHWALFTLDSCIFSLAVAYLYRYFNVFWGLSGSKITNDQMSDKVWDSIDDLLPIILSMLLLILAVRAFIYLSVSSFIGPFVMAIKVMIVSCGQFAVIYIIFLFVFSLMFTLMNVQTGDNNFANITESFITLFQAALGIFDLTQISDITLLRVAYAIYIVIYAILLLNMLIAILTDVYESHNSKWQALYLEQTFTVREVYASHVYHDYVTNTFFPFSVAFGILGPLIALFLPGRGKVRLNRVMIIIEYSIAFAVSLVAFVAVEMLLYPLAYFKCLLHKAVLLQRRRADGLFSFLSFLLLGPLILVGSLFSDIFYYTWHCYTISDPENETVDAIYRRSNSIGVDSPKRQKHSHPLLAEADKQEIPQSIYLATIDLVKSYVQNETVELKVLRDKIRTLVGLNNYRLVTGNNARRTSELGKAFIYSALVNFFTSAALHKSVAALEMSTGAEPHRRNKLVVNAKQMVNILMENYLMPKFRQKYKEFEEEIIREDATVAPTEKVPPTFGWKHGNKSLMGMIESQRALKKKGTMGTANSKDPDRRISIRLLRWNNTRGWENAFLGLKPISELIINQLRLAKEEAK